MAILVADSSVLIDLERGGLLEAAFLCGYAMVVPDFLFENELKEHNGSYLIQLGLSIVGLTPNEMQVVQDVQNRRAILSLEDCAALVCSARDQHVLLAGDGPLRAEAQARNVNCRGLIWLLDEMLRSQRVSPETLCEGLTRISQHPRCRLPKAELERRLQAWCT